MRGPAPAASDAGAARVQIVHTLHDRMSAAHLAAVPRSRMALATEGDGRTSRCTGVVDLYRSGGTDLVVVQWAAMAGSMPAWTPLRSSRTGDRVRMRSRSQCRWTRSRPRRPLTRQAQDASRQIEPDWPQNGYRATRGRPGFGGARIESRPSVEPMRSAQSNTTATQATAASSTRTNRVLGRKHRLTVPAPVEVERCASLTSAGKRSPPPGRVMFRR